MRSFILVTFLQLLFYNTFSTKNCSKTATENVIVELNEIIYFETPNFPFAEFPVEEGNYLCNFSLDSNITDLENVRLLFFYELYGNEYHLIEDLYDYHETIFNIQTNLANFLQPQSSFEAYKGYFLFQNIFDVECPMESITDTYEFRNENDVLYIRSGFDVPYYRNGSCQWKFNTSLEYGFKVVIEILNISTSTQLRIKNTTDLILTERNAKTFYPYYNSDNTITLMLSNNFENNFFPTLEFQAYITVVKKTQQKEEVNCEVLINSSPNVDVDGFIITWRYIVKDANTYKNNVFCNFELFIPPNFNVFANIYINAYLFEYNLEPGVDRVGYIDEYYGLRNIDENGLLLLKGLSNGTTRTVMFVYETDGSIPSKGFTVDFMLIPCGCIDFIDIAGNVGTSFHIMKVSELLCRNMECYIPIIAYPPIGNIRLDIQIEIEKKNLPHVFDIIEIISNDTVIFKIDESFGEYATYSYTIFLNSEQNNIFHLSTSNDEYIYFLTIYGSIMEIPEDDLNYVLEESQTFLVVDIPLVFYFYKGIASIQLSENLVKRNYTMTLYTNILNVLAHTELFMTRDLNTVVSYEKCFIPNTIYEYQCITQNKNIAAFVAENTFNGETEFDHFPQQYLAFQNPHDYGGCLYNNIYITKDLPYVRVATLSITNDPCIIIILTDASYYIKNLWTTSSYENVKISSGTDIKNVIYQFNSKTINSLKDVMLTTKVYYVTIPKKSAFSIELLKMRFNDKIFTVKEYPYRSIIPSSSYGTFTLDATLNVMIECTPAYNISDYPVKYTVLNISSTLPFYLYSFTTYEKKQLRNIGETIIVENDLIQFFCHWRACMSLPCKALLFMETINSQ